VVSQSEPPKCVTRIRPIFWPIPWINSKELLYDHVHWRMSRRKPAKRLTVLGKSLHCPSGNVRMSEDHPASVQQAIHLGRLEQISQLPVIEIDVLPSCSGWSTPRCHRVLRSTAYLIDLIALGFDHNDVSLGSAMEQTPPRLLDISGYLLLSSSICLFEIQQVKSRTLTWREVARKRNH